MCEHKLMCFGGIGTHREAGRYGPAWLTALSWDAICNLQELNKAQLSTEQSWQEDKKPEIIWPEKNKGVIRA